MERLVEHRGAARRPARVDGTASYAPARTAGRWWEYFEVRTVDVGAGGFRLISTVPVRTGARLKLVVPPAEESEPPVTVEGEIVWVSEPLIPWLGTYHAGVVFRPAGQEGAERLLARTAGSRM